MRNLIGELLLFKSPNTYYKWKKENRPIIALLETYFTKEDLEEFLETGKIGKFEEINRIEDFKKENRGKYLSFNIDRFGSIEAWDENSLYVYFSYLNFLKENYKSFKSFQSAFISFSFIFINKLSHSSERYDKIESLSKRVFPFIEWMDTQSGMYFYVTTILLNNLEHLKDAKMLKKFIDEANLHIEIFKNPDSVFKGISDSMS
ncbi:MAG: hypothetical protein WC667_09095 [Sulfurimonas sp.]